MLSLVLAGSLLAASPPVLPEEPATTGPVAEGPSEAAPTEAAAPSEAAAPAPAPTIEPAPEPSVDAIVIEAPPAAAPPAEPAPDEVEAAPSPVVVVDRRVAVLPPPPPPPRQQMVPKPPWSGSGRFVGGAIMLIAGTGLLTAATFEFADGRDTTQPLISQIPAGVSMLAAGGLMIGTAARDQRRLAEWETATGIDARPSGNGMIIAGVAVGSLGAMAAIATSIAVDMELDAPLSIPAGWATAGVGLGTGTALLIAGIVRRSRYGKWRDGLRGVPMVAPSRAGATVGVVGQF